MTDEKEKERPVPRWHPETRADKNRKKDREEKAKEKGGAPAETASAPAAAPESGEPFTEYIPDAFDMEKVRCRCGRTVMALCIVDVRGLPPELRGDADEVCDGCWTAWVREEKISRAELARLQGAPYEVVEHIRSHGHPHLP